MTSREIAEMVYAEHNPLVTLSFDEAVDRIESLIDTCNVEYHLNQIKHEEIKPSCPVSNRNCVNGCANRVNCPFS